MDQPRRVRVCVPASTSNLGPGFDALGLALDLQTTVEVEAATTTWIEIAGRGAALLSRGTDNLVYRRMEEFARWQSQTLPPVALRIENGIPLERGLGASGAASLCGLLAANALLHTGLDRAQLLDLACRLEGHPDNVTPSLLGGCTVSVVIDGHVTALHVPFPDDLVCALCIPDLHMPTHAARDLMPHSYSRADAVFNLSRAALLVTALATRQFDVLPIAVQDRMHQPYRAHMFGALPAVIHAAHAAGALGAFLSGAGSTVAAFASADRAERIARAMATACDQHSLACETRVATINRNGATVTVD